MPRARGAGTTSTTLFGYSLPLAQIRISAASTTLPLHVAVSERNAFAIQLLLDAGADPDMPTRIDECESAVEMAQAAGLHEIAAMLVRKGQPLRQPHLAYGDRGVPGVIPPDTLLNAEIAILSAAHDP